MEGGGKWEYPNLESALRDAERAAVKVGEIHVEEAVEIAREEIQRPEIRAVWRDATEVGNSGDVLFPHRKVAALLIEDSVDPPAVGHALVQAAHRGRIHCVHRLRDIQARELSASLVTGTFSAFAFFKAAEQNQVEVVQELLRTSGSCSLSLMGYVIATKYRDDGYPFVEVPLTGAGDDWRQRLLSVRGLLPGATPSFESGVWELRGLRGNQEILHEATRATFRTFFLWRAGLVAAANGHGEVFRVLLRQRGLENTLLADSSQGGKHGFDAEEKKIIALRTRIDTLMYQLVEELSTRQYKDVILHALWSHIQRGGRDSPRPSASRSRCVAQAQNGLWELQLEVPLLLMPVEQCYMEDEPFRRYKQLTDLFNQRARINIQLVETVEATPTFLQVTVRINHVRCKVDNSRWDDHRMGHFPSLIFLSVMPETSEGTGVTMTNSSANQTFKVGVGERVSASTGITDVVTGGARATFGVSAGISVSTTVKTTPWRFEQLPVHGNRGGSFVWTLQGMKGQEFNRLNPQRMAEATSVWRFGRRVPGNPLHSLPFTSEGGIIFTGNDFADTLMWRFPKSMNDTQLKWSIEGHIHCTFTTTRYWETRMATFRGDIEEKVKALEEKAKDDEKGEKKDKKDKKDKGEGDATEDGEDSEKKKKKKDKEKGGGDATEDGEEESEKKKKKKKEKEKGEDDDEDDSEKAKKKKEKKEKKAEEEDDGTEGGEESEKKEKEKEKKAEEEGDETEGGEDSEKKKKKKEKAQRRR